MGDNRKGAALVLGEPSENMALLRHILAHSVRTDRGCRLWQLSTKNGYGQVSVHGAMLYTHRVIHELLVGPVPPGVFVLHRCDTPPCNEWSHLFLGTQRDNVLDMWTKGRGVRPPRHVGEAHPLVTLADVDVGEIRALFARGVRQRAIARQFECAQSTISRYVNRVTRADAPDPVGVWMPPQQLSLLETA
jgi:HNH endonuclease